jgi:O-methyltransferase
MESPQTAASCTPAAALYQMITGFYLSRAVCAAADLGLADLLRDGPRNSADLARATGTHEQSLFRVLRLLASAGVFAEDGAGTFALSPIGEYLRSDVRDSMRPVAQLFAGPLSHAAWGELGRALRTGEPTPSPPLFDYLPQDPQLAAIFNQAAISLTRDVSSGVASYYDFTPFRTVVDVGGGHGELLIRVLVENPGLNGLLLDLPNVIEGAREHIECAGLTERIKPIGGDFFGEVPAGADVYLIKSIIHDWNDEQSIKILTNCRRAMNADGRVLLIELVMPDRVDQTPDCRAATEVDVNMMVILGGQVRTENHYRTLFEASGIKLTRVIPLGATASGIPRITSVIEGIRA